MSWLFQNDLIVISLFAVSVFIFSYLTSDKIINFFYKKSLGSREEILSMMDKMLISSDKKKVSNALMFLSFGLGGIVYLLVWPNIIMAIILSVFVILASFAIPKNIMNSNWEKRCSQLTIQMVDGMTIMSNGVKSSLTVPQAMERVCENMDGPIKQEFGLILNKLRLGMSFEDALEEFADRIQRPDVQMFVTSVNILKETGGNLAETFDTITFTIRERQKIERKIEAMTSASIMQGIIITLVPFILLIAFLFLDPAYVMPMFTKPLGWFALAIMIGLQGLGGFLMKKIVTIKVQQKQTLNQFKHSRYVCKNPRNYGFIIVTRR